MDLWIRSQDKERLIKPIEFYIEETIDYVNKSSQFEIYALNVASNDIIVGTYQTKERALEVLNEIENTIYINKLFIADISAFQKALENEGYTEEEISKALRTISVYQMPEE